MKIRLSFLILFFCYSNFVLAQLSSEEIDNISDWGKSNIESDIKGTIDSLEKVVLILENKNLKKNADIYSLLGGFYLTQLNDHEKALLYYEKINQLSIYHNNDPSILAKYHQDMGRLYIYEDTNIEKAFKEFKMALNVLEKSNNEIPFEIYSNYSVALLGQDSLQKALEYFVKSKELFDKKNNHSNKDSSFLVLFSSNMGVSYLKSGQLDSAEFYLICAVELSQTLKQPKSIFQSLVYLGVFYQEQNRYDEAISIFNLALDFLSQIKYKYVYKRLLFESLADCYSNIGDYHKAHDYRQKQIVYSDSLRNQKLSEFSYVIEYKNKIESLKLKTKLDETEFKYLTQKKKTLLFYIL
jgi:tetratricopeptide (TPR) repeat protein